MNQKPLMYYYQILDPDPLQDLGPDPYQNPDTDPQHCLAQKYVALILKLHATMN